MHLNIKITGPAGLGMNSTADIISHIFADMGYLVSGDNEYQSLIKWGLNWFDLNISDTAMTLEKATDIIIAFNDKNLENTLPVLKDWGYVIVNKKFSDKLTGLEKYNVLDLEIQDKYDNTYLLWMLAKLLWFQESLMLDKIEHVFARKWADVVKKNQDIVSNIYATYELPHTSPYSIKSVGPARKISYGNKALAWWAIESDLEYYAAYPMTPASTILSEVVNSKKITYLQAEDEISVINSALWASYTGARSMVGTSGGWFALMSEALSFAVQAEIPVVAVLSQRAGPSTGTPTFHEQGDLHYALNPTFGDFEHIVLYPSTLEEAYYMSGQALNLADKYQNPVILLMDKQSSEFHGTILDETPCEVNRGKMIDTPAEDYKRYELTDDGISPRVKVGTKNGDFIATSYEHDEYGATTEESSMRMAMTEKKFKKLENFFEKEWISGYEVINPTAKKMLLTTSFTSYNAKEFIKNNPEFGLILVKFLKPLDHRLIDDLKWVEELIFLESNYSGQLENYMTKELGLKHISGLKISHKRKYDLYPFYMEDLEELK